MKKRLWLFFLFLLVAQSESLAGLPRPYGGKIRVPLEVNESSTDPAQAVEFPELVLCRQMHVPPLLVDERGKLRPILLVHEPKWMEGEKEIELDILPQLVDHRGLAISGRDFVESWQRLLDPAVDSPHWWLLAPLEGAREFAHGQKNQLAGLRLEHELRVVVTLHYPLPQFLEVLAALPLAPLSVAARSPSAAGRSGCGPFLMSEERELKYFLGCPAGRPYLDTVEMVVPGSERENQMSFHAGRLHLVEAPWGGQSVSSPPSWPIFLAYHQQLSEKLPKGLQQALGAVLERKALAVITSAWGAQPMYGLLEEAELEVDSKESEVIRDYQEKMSRLQAIAPMNFRLLIRRGDTLERLLAEKIQLQLLKIGLALTLEEAGRQEFRQRLKSGNYHFYFARPYLPVRHPFLRLLGALAYLAGDRERAWHLIEELQQRWIGLNKGDCQDKICLELEKSFRARVPAIALLRHGYAYRLASALSGFLWRADGLPDFSWCWLRRE